MNRAYSEAAVEVLDILDHTAVEKVNLIPLKFINYLKENAATDYEVNLDYSKPINEMNIKVETKGILGTICRNWWWNEEQKEEYRKIVNDNDIKKQEELKAKYNTDNLFNKSEVNNVEAIKTEEVVENAAISEYKEENIFKKILNKILSLFKK